MRKKLNEIQEKDINRFWSKVNIKSKEECWPWIGAVDKDGYGRFSFQRFYIRSNRAALYFSKGGNHDGMLCMHICDNPICCNPDHLKWGTHEENTQDMILKGRNNPPRGDRHPFRKRPESIFRGENHKSSKLTNAQVVESKNMFYNGHKIKDIAEKFGVSYGTIREMIKGRNWPHMVDAVGIKDFRIEISDENAKKIIEMYGSKKYTQKEIAEVFNINPCTVSRLAHSKRRINLLNNVNQ